MLARAEVAQVLDHQADIVRYRAGRSRRSTAPIITQPAVEAFSSGLFNRVPIMTGLVATNRPISFRRPNTHKPLTAETFERLRRLFRGRNTKQMLLTKYPLANYPNPSLAEIAMAQAMKSCVARLLDRAWAKYVPVYGYQFDDRTAPSYFPDLSYPMRAYHTAELQYLFPLFHGGQGTPHPLNDAQQRLST